MPVCGGALRFLLRQAAARHGMAEQDGAVLEATTGLTVLAMGKYGAYELNYSSDIDLVVFYDAERFPFAKRGDARGAAVDIVRGLVKLIAETTSDGYVFRTDLRLRPDAGATQVAISLDAAEDYYESLGQNWERAAMIKARPCAGDPETGRRFPARRSRPSSGGAIWISPPSRTFIPSSARSMPMPAMARSRWPGHNIKLGRGGIREIEFFAQTQQLILGGRHPDLRAPATLDALAALAAHGTITAETAADLTRAYRYLRMLEHRLQMIEDEQTHTVPKSAEGVAHVACFMGYDDARRFPRRADAHCWKRCRAIMPGCSSAKPDLTDSHGNLVFTGVEDDPETLETLRAMGFGDAVACGGRDPRLASWPHPRHAFGAGARASHQADARDPEGAGGDRRSRRGLCPVRPFSVQPAVGRAAFLAVPGAAGISRPAGARWWARRRGWPRIWRAHPATLDALLDADFLARLPARAAAGRQACSASLHGGYEEHAGWRAALRAGREFPRRRADWWMARPRRKQAGPAFAAHRRMRDRGSAAAWWRPNWRQARAAFPARTSP